MYLFSRLLHIIKRRPLVNLISAGLLQSTQSASAVNRENGAMQTWNSSGSPNEPVNARGEDENTRPSSPSKVEGSTQNDEMIRALQAPNTEWRSPSSPRCSS